MKFAILAAGEGSRLADEGIQEPKPLVRLLGEPMLDRLVRIFCACGAEEVVMITNNLTPLTQEHVRQLQAAGTPIRMVVKTTPSSMHSFYELAPLLGQGRFILTTVDTIFREEEFRHYVQAFEQAGDELDGMMAVTDFVDDERPLWLSTAADLRITGFHDSPEQFRQSGAEGELRYISGGIYGLSDRCFPTLRRCILGGQSRMRNFQRAMVADGLRLRACPFSKILDVDHAADIPKAEAFLRKTILGIPRSTEHSPNMADADAAIFEAVATLLRERGHEVRLGTAAISEDAAAMDIVPTAEAAFIMSRSPEVLHPLAEAEARGLRCINSPRALLQMGSRRFVHQALAEHGIPQPATTFVATTAATLPTLAYPVWLKREEGYSQVRDDVVLARDEDEARAALAAFARRDIGEVAVSEHVQGDLVKFYGVAGTDFFDWDYADPAHSKFGLEAANGPTHRYAFDAGRLRLRCDALATAIGVPVYGGDAVVRPDGSFAVIDFNDWPSFSRCRQRAAKAIVQALGSEK